MTAAEAAVEAMAEALVPLERYNRDGRRVVENATRRSRAALTALVESEPVRQALVGVFSDHVCPSSEECLGGRIARQRVADVLAALRPEARP